MSICSRMTLAQFGRLALSEEDALPIDQVASMLDEVAGRAARVIAVKAKLDALVARRYGARALYAREVAHGRAEPVTLIDGDFIVTADLQQEVRWDQKKLAQSAEAIFHDWQRDPEDYINISYTVDEPVYLGWPPELRKHFEDARSVGEGKQSFSISAAKRSKPKKGVS